MGIQSRKYSREKGNGNSAVSQNAIVACSASCRHRRYIGSNIDAGLRAGNSEGDAPQMRNFIGLAASWPMRGNDTLLLRTSWGSPPDKTLKSQSTSEVNYRLHVTQNLTVTPDLQITFNPSFNEVENVIYVVGLRVRMSF
jgi:carbohydrate-selective porin OprB